VDEFWLNRSAEWGSGAKIPCDLGKLALSKILFPIEGLGMSKKSESTGTQAAKHRKPLWLAIVVASRSGWRSSSFSSGLAFRV